MVTVKLKVRVGKIVELSIKFDDEELGVEPRKTIAYVIGDRG